MMMSVAVAVVAATAVSFSSFSSGLADREDDQGTGGNRPETMSNTGAEECTIVLVTHVLE